MNRSPRRLACGAVKRRQSGKAEGETRITNRGELEGMLSVDYTWEPGRWDAVLTDNRTASSTTGESFETTYGPSGVTTERGASKSQKFHQSYILDADDYSYGDPIPYHIHRTHTVDGTIDVPSAGDATGLVDGQWRQVTTHGDDPPVVTADNDEPYNPLEEAPPKKPVTTETTGEQTFGELAYNKVRDGFNFFIDVAALYPHYLGTEITVAGETITETGRAAGEFVGDHGRYVVLRS